MRGSRSGDRASIALGDIWQAAGQKSACPALAHVCLRRGSLRARRCLTPSPALDMLSCDPRRDPGVRSGHVDESTLWSRPSSVVSQMPPNLPHATGDSPPESGACQGDEWDQKALLAWSSLGMFSCTARVSSPWDASPFKTPRFSSLPPFPCSHTHLQPSLAHLV